MGHTVELTSIHLQIVYKFYVKYVFALCVYIATWDILEGYDHVCKWVNNSVKMTVRTNNLTGHLQRAEQKTKAENCNLPS
jgi:hypothetical protein